MTAKRAHLLLGAALIAGCASAIPLPTDQDFENGRRVYPDVTSEELRLGRERYVAKCAGCHTLYVPSARLPAAWPKLVEQMAERAKLSAADRQAIERYLVTIARR